MWSLERANRSDMDTEKVCTFPGAPGIIDMVIRFLSPNEVASLALCSTWIRDIALEDVRWYKYYQDEFKRPAVRSPCDSALPISCLFSRRWMRRNFKNQVEPIVRRLELVRARPTANDDSHKHARDGTGYTASRSRSRGESMDESKQSGIFQPRDVQESDGVGRSGVEGLPGAMRFVHLGKHGVALGSTDQGHLAAWLLHPRRPQGMAPSAQCDAFDAAMCAKRRRDAKRKYVDGARKENKLVYFKIQAAANRAGRMSGGGSLDDEFAGFSMWGNGGETQAAGAGTSVHSKSERSDSDAQGDEGRSGYSDAIDSDSSVRSSSGPAVSSTPWLDWNSPDRDKAGGFDRSAGKRGKGAGKGRGPHTEPMDVSDRGGEPDSSEVADRHGSLDSTGGLTPSGGGGGYSDDSTGQAATGGRRGSKGKDKPKLKGKDLWSAADRAKWEEKQAKAEARQAAAKAKAHGAKAGRLGQQEAEAAAADVAMVEATCVEVATGLLAIDYSIEGAGEAPPLALGLGLGLGLGPSDSSTTQAGKEQESARKKPYASKAERKALRKMSTGSDVDASRPVTPTKGKAGASGATIPPLLPTMEDLQAALLQGIRGSSTRRSLSRAASYDHDGERAAADDEELDAEGEGEGEEVEQTEEVDADHDHDHDPTTLVNLRQGLSEASELKPSSLVRRGKKANRKAREQAEWAAAQEAKAKRVAAGGKLPRQGGLAPAVKVFDDAPSAPPQPSKSPVPATTPTKGLGAASGQDAFSPSLMSRKPPTSPPLKALGVLAATAPGGTRSTSPLPGLGLGLGLALPTALAAAAGLEGARPPSPPTDDFGPGRSTSAGASRTPNKAFHPLRPSSAGSRTPTHSGVFIPAGSPAPMPLLTAGGGDRGDRTPTHAHTHTHGTRLRSDIWFAAQWVHQEQPLRRKWMMPRSSSTAGSTPFSPPFGVSSEPRPVGSGMGMTCHAVVSFGDGTLGVVSPQAVSPKLNDVVLLPSDTGLGEDVVQPAPSKGMSKAGRPSSSTPPQPHVLAPVVAEAQHLAPPKTRYARQDGGVYVPPWMQRSMTWLDRPQGEDKEAVSAVFVEAGRPLLTTHAPRGPAPDGDMPVAAVVSDREPDTIVASFGRVVGVWRFTTPRTLATATSTSLSSPPLGKEATGRSRTLSDLDIGAKASNEGSASALHPPSAPSLVPAQVKGKTGKGKGGGKEQKGGKGGGSKGAAASASVEDSATSPRASTHPDAAAPVVGQDADRSVTAVGVARLHAHLVTALAGHRKLHRRGVVHVSALAASMVQAGTVPVPQTGEDCITIASGDANGDVILWDASTQGKVAALQINRRGGTGKEGVACLKLHDEILVAGGSEGTVVVWKRRFVRHEVPRAGAGLADAAWIEVEATPELIFRETRAHSIVRVIAVPPPSVRLCAVVTGGGEGDVRLWPMPAMFVRPPAGSGGQVHGAQGHASAPSTPMEGSTPTPTPLHAATPSPTPCKVLKGHSARITGLHLDAVKVVSCSLDGTAKVWDLMEHCLGRNLATLRVPAGDELSSLHVHGRDILLGGVHGAVHHFRFGGEGRSGDKEEGGFGAVQGAVSGTSGGMMSATGSGGLTVSSGVSSSSLPTAGSGPNGGATLKDQLWHGVTGGSSSSRKGGAEAAYGGRNAGGKRDKPASHVKRRGMRDLRALVKVQGSSVGQLGFGRDEGDGDMGLEDEGEDEEALTPHERAQLAEIEDEQLAIAMAASLT